MHTRHKSMLYLLVATITLASCKKDISREAFAGLKLGSTYRQYVEGLKSPKFSSYKNHTFYPFETEKGKQFYAKVYCGWNKDSIILFQEVYISQHKEGVPVLGKSMFNKEVGVDFNLVADNDEEVAQPEEIYQFLRQGYSSKYKLLEETTYDENSINVNKSVYKSSKDVMITLFKYANLNPFEFEGLISPTECIKVRYELTEDFIKDNHLNNYYSRTQDL